MGWGRGGDLAGGTAEQSGWTADHHTLECIIATGYGIWGSPREPGRGWGVKAPTC